MCFFTAGHCWQRSRILYFQLFLLNASQLKCIVFGPDSFLYPVNMMIQRHAVSPNSDTLCDRFQHAAKENHKLFTAWEISINTFSSKSRRRSRLLVLFSSDGWPRSIKWFLNRQPVSQVTSYIFIPNQFICNCLQFLRLAFIKQAVYVVKLYIKQTGFFYTATLRLPSRKYVFGLIFDESSLLWLCRALQKPSRVYIFSKPLLWKWWWIYFQGGLCQR